MEAQVRNAKLLIAGALVVMTAAGCVQDSRYPSTAYNSGYGYNSGYRYTTTNNNSGY
jgi:hypothetical protein